MSETRGWKPSNTWYRTATEIGPESVWSSMKQVPLNPSSGSVSYYTQHDFVLPVIGTKDTTFIYCGDRWTIYASTNYGNQTGRQAWFPIRFDDKGAITICAPSYTTNGGDWKLNLSKGTWSVP